VGQQARVGPAADVRSPEHLYQGAHKVPQRVVGAAQRLVTDAQGFTGMFID